MRSLWLGMIVLLASVSGNPAKAEPWRSADPGSEGWSIDILNKALDRAGRMKPTALMIVHKGRVIARLGDVNRKVDVASIRKSLLGSLYGIAVAEGRIDPKSTLADLAIDDKPPVLTATEKQATVHDLLTARSGVYHPAAHETAEMKKNRPARSSHSPGSFWFYNNWDFNALATIYRQKAGQDVFQAFARSIANPIGMEDFSERDGRYALNDNSIHPAYPFRMTARDMARFGQLYLDRGRWNGRQVVPATWVTASTTAYSRTDRGNMGYGYLWWTLNPEVFGTGAALASGYGGQFIAVIPSKHVVIVQLVDLTQNPVGVRTSDFVHFSKAVMAAAPQ